MVLLSAICVFAAAINVAIAHPRLLGHHGRNSKRSVRDIALITFERLIFSHLQIIIEQAADVIHSVLTQFRFHE
jgi:hypothetical protein